MVKFHFQCEEPYAFRRGAVETRGGWPGCLTSLGSLPLDADLRRVEPGASTVNGEDRYSHERVDDP